MLTRCQGGLEFNVEMEVLSGAHHKN
ncbi:hypothetical protein NC653_041273 [Populus alba x Populus x berolinensis]|uniref:Uncharacterized protein n=1 Tax=Populus alba x Populus x berolinensis TaxID=444605 RepID=A0AAD6L937_9ROSI|nr:hypothetical protein NC653_041273 [Populus alba x Populus x berolinensis]